jgi:hypothetical protein
MSPATLLLALGLAAVPAPGDDPPDLRAGIRLVEEGDLDRAVAALGQAARALDEERAPGPVQARAHLYLAMAYLGLGELDAAREEMRAVWRHDPALVLDAKDYAPPVVALHEEARPRPGTSAAPAAAVVSAAPPARGRHLPALIGLGAVASVTGVALSGRGGSAAPPAAPPPAADAGPPMLRLSNCDDECSATVNGFPLVKIGLGLNSGWVDLSGHLHQGANEIKFELFNRHGGIAYTFELRKGETVLFGESCGVANRDGCDGNQRYPEGPARSYTYTLFQSEARREK